MSDTKWTQRNVLIYTYMCISVSMCDSNKGHEVEREGVQGEELGPGMCGVRVM